MTSVLSEGDKIFGMYKQYKALLDNDTKQNKDELHLRTTKIVASQLTVAHMLDHVACLMEEKKAPKTRLETYSEDG